MFEWLLSTHPQEPDVRRLASPEVRQAVVEAVPKGTHVVRLAAETEPSAQDPQARRVELDLSPDDAEALAGRLLDTARKARRCNDFRAGR